MSPMTNQQVAAPKPPKESRASLSKTKTQELHYSVQPAVATCRPYLLLLSGIDMGLSVPIENKPEGFVIGRSEDSDLQIDASEISRHHARFESTPEGNLQLIDLQSINGTYVNDSRIHRALIQDGDKIQLGPHQLLKFTKQDHQEHEFYRQMFNRVSRDPLTDVLNRRYFFEALEREWSFGIRHQSPVSIALLDLDHFKKINDQYGHLAGDQILKEFAQRSLYAIRKEDVLARYGGEEFVILFRQTAHPEAQIIAERIRQSCVQTPFLVSPHAIPVTASIGTSTYYPSPNNPLEPNKLLQIADQNLYHAKNNGRNCIISSAL